MQDQEKNRQSPQQGGVQGQPEQFGGQHNSDIPGQNRPGQNGQNGLNEDGSEMEGEKGQVSQ